MTLDFIPIYNVPKITWPWKTYFNHQINYLIFYILYFIFLLRVHNIAIIPHIYILFPLILNSPIIYPFYLIIGFRSLLSGPFKTLLLVFSQCILADILFTAIYNDIRSMMSKIFKTLCLVFQQYGLVGNFNSVHNLFGSVL